MSVNIEIGFDNKMRVDVGDSEQQNLNDLFLKANIASEAEKQVGVKEAIFKYPKEVFWAIIFALGLVMAGYDAQIISSLYVHYLLTLDQQTKDSFRYGLPAFNKKFGVLQQDGSYGISAVSKTGSW